MTESLDTIDQEIIFEKQLLHLANLCSTPEAILSRRRIRKRLEDLTKQKYVKSSETGQPSRRS